MKKKAALTIAGLDPSNGAGLTADLAVFHHFGIEGLSAATAITVQNSCGVQRVEPVSPDLVREQAMAALSDRSISAVKTGMLATSVNAEVIVSLMSGVGSKIPLVVDPVMGASRGKELTPTTRDLCAAIERLLHYTTIITPNLPEAQVLCGFSVTTLAEMERAAKYLVDKGAQCALIKGGHREGAPIDIAWNGKELLSLPGTRIEGEIHGTGCHLSAAITAMLAMGRSITESITESHRFLHALLPLSTRPGIGELRYIKKQFA